MASPLCATCLTPDRWLKPIQAFMPRKFSAVWKQFLTCVTQETLICWECEASMLRIARFALQASRAQAILTMHQGPARKNLLLPPMQSYSRLALRPVIHLNVDVEPKTLPVEDEPTQPNGCILTLGQVMDNIKSLPKRKIQNPVNVIPNRILYPNLSSSVTETIVIDDRNDARPLNGNNPNHSLIIQFEPNDQAQSYVDRVINESIKNKSISNLTNLVDSLKNDYCIQIDDIKTEEPNEVVPSDPANPVQTLKIGDVRSLNPVIENCRSVWREAAVNIGNIKTVNNIKASSHADKTQNGLMVGENGIMRTADGSKPRVIEIIQSPATASNKTDSLDFEDSIPVTTIATEEKDWLVFDDGGRQRMIATDVPKDPQSHVVEQPRKANMPTVQSDLDKNSPYLAIYADYVETGLESPPKKFRPGAKQKRIKDPIPKPISVECDNVEQIGSATESVKKSAKPCKFTLKLLTMEQVFAQKDINKTRPRYLNCRFKCKSCVKGWDFHREYDNHNRQFHPKVHETTGTSHTEIANKAIPAYLCYFCGIRSKDRQSMVKHYNQHFTVYKCPNCEYAHHELEEMEAHDAMEHPAEGTLQDPTQRVVYESEYNPWNTQKSNPCQKFIVNKATPSTPRRAVHAKVNCPHCGIMFPKTEMESHMRRRHPELAAFANRFKSQLI